MSSTDHPTRSPKRHRRVGLAAVVLLVATVSYLGGRWLSNEHEGGAVARSEGAVPGAAALDGPRDRRAEVRDIIRAEVEELATRDDVEAYLDRLVARARERGAVTALEVEPGFAAIDRVARQVGPVEAEWMRMRFDNRMVRLTEELGSRSRQEGGSG